MRLVMTCSRFIVVGTLVVFATLGWAQKSAQTQAEGDGLAGPVKSISTLVQMSDVNFIQPNGPALILPLWCRECAYSPDGYQTRFGDNVDGHFVGETMALTRDADGRVTEVLMTNVQTGQPEQDTIMGAFGKVEEISYSNGKILQQQTFRYDEYGQVLETILTDPAGVVLNRGYTNWTKDGTFTEASDWGKDQQLVHRTTYDPATDEQRTTEYDDSGHVVQTWTYAHGQVTSFWEPFDGARPFGVSFSDFNDKTNVRAWSCHGNGICQASQVHYQFADSAKKNPTSAEWRDSNGNLIYGAYYAYAFDQNGNWTHREISVWNAELGTRTPYETDDRLITYWE